MINKPDISGMYQDYIQKQNDKNSEERYVGKEEYYHASATGTCLRKHWYQTNNAPKTNPPNLVSNRIMRLGTIVHSDYEKALKMASEYNNINNNTINSSIYSSNIERIITEGEIQIPEYNVRGFYDALFIMNSGEVLLYDFKTIRSYPYSLKFGRKKEQNFMSGRANTLHELQLATYGLAIKEEYGRLDGMFLYYYNKDSSQIKEVSVDFDYLELAKEYWEEVKENCNGTVAPPVKEYVSPRQAWECNYCNYQTHCQEN